MSIRLRWEPRHTPRELRPMLRALAEEYPVFCGKGAGTLVSFEKLDACGQCEVALAGASAKVRYFAPAQAGRAVGSLLSGLVKEGSPCRETTPFHMFGIMLDCSRNAVMTPGHLRKWLRRLALLGYNMVMLYTEDTYELPGEPYFGYQRGAYTARELREIDAYAASLNIEIIPCIQTLGHLEKILRHHAYSAVRDTASVMLVGERKTYELIEKMIRQWSSICRTSRIHIGMDETHDLGRGRYLDMHGYRRGFDLFNEHLAEVVRICRRHGLKPMIWSDMYFRLGCESGNYYDPATVIPADVVGKIPGEVELVYWDYYHPDRAFYLDWIARHRRMGKEPLMGSGIWTWNKYWYDWRTTERNAGACIEACRQSGVREIFFTQWGDNGAYCDHDSAFAGMVYCADKAYGAEKPSLDYLCRRFSAVCGGSYAAHILAGDIHGGIADMQPDMWDDPFFDTRFRGQMRDKPEKMADCARRFAELARKLEPHRNSRATGNFNYACRTAQAFADRYGISARLLAAYRWKDKAALRKIAKDIPRVRRSLRQMADAFRNMWLSHNKPQGIEAIQSRFGMLEARYREMGRRIEEYLRGSVAEIPELASRCPPR